MPPFDATFLTLQTGLAGEYSLEREIGRGGMGIVYLAREVQLDRLVAIKALPPELAVRDDVRERFLREARTAAGLSHPNIVPIHRVGQAGDIPYFVMTYVRGETLGERLRARGPLSAAMLTRVMQEVALALGYAHGRGIIHRDVKPDNILIEEGSERALVTDFGIAHLASEDQASEPVMGTMQFMSPEQARGESIDGRSDVYALGVVGYIAASGRLPFEEPTASRSLARVASGALAAPVATVASGLTASLARTIDRCLEPDPSRRFATAEQVAEAIGATANRQTLPATLAYWAGQPAPMMAVYGLWSAGWLWAVVMQSVALRHYGLKSLVYANMALIPLVPIALFQLRKTYTAVAAGYSIDDLRAALRVWIDQRRAELTAAASVPEPFWVGLLRMIPPLSAALIPVSFVAGTMFAEQPLNLPPRSLQYIVNGLAIAVSASIGLAAGLGVPLLPPSEERKIVGRIRTALWNSRIGAWLARALTPKVRGVPEANFRPTEMALELAVDELFAALPASYKQAVGDLPAVARRLSQHVGELRVEVERLETMKTHARREEAAAIDPLLGSARTQLGQTVTALETIRMELLRLHGGASNLRPLTTSIDSARNMMEHIARLRAAEDELEARPRKRLAIDSRTPSPA